MIDGIPAPGPSIFTKRTNYWYQPAPTSSLLKRPIYSKLGDAIKVPLIATLFWPRWNAIVTIVNIYWGFHYWIVFIYIYIYVYIYIYNYYWIVRAHFHHLPSCAVTERPPTESVSRNHGISSRVVYLPRNPEVAGDRRVLRYVQQRRVSEVGTGAKVINFCE